MAADILFGRNRMWSVQTDPFNEMLLRAEKHCEDDPLIMDLLGFARVVGCLAINRYREASVRRRLARCLHAAASELLLELGPNPAPEVGSREFTQRLVDLTDEVLRETDDGQ